MKLPSRIQKSLNPGQEATERLSFNLMVGAEASLMAIDELRKALEDLHHAQNGLLQIIEAVKSLEPGACK